MEKRIQYMKSKIPYLIIIIALILGLLFTINSCSEKINQFEIEYKLKHDSLKQISDTQYRKLIADTLTIKELKKEVSRLQLENIKKPRIITEIDWKIKDGEKIVDTLFLPTKDQALFVSDYYPNKEKPFVNYTLKDSVGKFKFYPAKISLVVSENNDGTWQVDSKVPEYFQITDIKAVGLKKKPIEKTSPFYIGGGVQKQNDKYPLSVLGGFRIKRTIIFGGINTNGQVEVKTLYNL